MRWQLPNEWRAFAVVGTRGLLEDTACTVKLDAKLWEDATAPCRPTVALTEVCKHE